MISTKALFCCVIVAITCTLSYSYVINSEFNAPSEPADSVYAKWVLAGSNAVIDSVFSINVTAIPDSAKYAAGDSLYSIPSAIPNNNLDDHLSLQELINWLRGRPWLQGIHAEIYIPPGVYNFSDQIEMFSNISLKGAGSHQTELRFLIRARSSGTPSTADCKKDAILINGDGINPPQRKRNIGIEDLKITREDGGLSPREIKTKVGDYENGYWGNNIAIRRATDCWVKGVESENTFRNHVTLEFANHSKYQISNYTKVDR